MRTVPIDFVRHLDLAFSFTGRSIADVDFVKAAIDGRVSTYDYRDWLDIQSGQLIDSFSRTIYSSLPSIIFATSDFYNNRATNIELSFLKKNPEPKLIIDYRGDFCEREVSEELEYWEVCQFDDANRPSLPNVRRFLAKAFPSLEVNIE